MLVLESSFDVYSFFTKLKQPLCQELKNLADIKNQPFENASIFCRSALGLID